jgi:hypothetical protein
MPRKELIVKFRCIHFCSVTFALTKSNLKYIIFPSVQLMILQCTGYKKVYNKLFFMCAKRKKKLQLSGFTWKKCVREF